MKSSVLRSGHSLAIESAGNYAFPEGAEVWPDHVSRRVHMIKLLERLNTELLCHDSATLTLERWCVNQDLVPSAKVTASCVRDLYKPLPVDLSLHLLGIASDMLVRYRRVHLMCGQHILSEADNWYLPDRLDATMNHNLDHTDVPFGKVVQSLGYRRKTLSAQLLWSLVDIDGAVSEPSPVPTTADDRLMVPREVMRHRALLCDASGIPFSALLETYTHHVLGVY